MVMGNSTGHRYHMISEVTVPSVPKAKGLKAYLCVSDLHLEVLRRPLRYWDPTPTAKVKATMYMN